GRTEQPSQSRAPRKSHATREGRLLICFLLRLFGFLGLVFASDLSARDGSHGAIEDRHRAQKTPGTKRESDCHHRSKTRKPHATSSGPGQKTLSDLGEAVGLLDQGLLPPGKLDSWRGEEAVDSPGVDLLNLARCRIVDAPDGRLSFAGILADLGEEIDLVAHEI